MNIYSDLTFLLDYVKENADFVLSIFFSIVVMVLLIRLRRVERHLARKKGQQANFARWKDESSRSLRSTESRSPFSEAGAGSDGEESLEDIRSTFGDDIYRGFAYEFDDDDEGGQEMQKPKPRSAIGFSFGNLGRLSEFGGYSVDPKKKRNVERSGKLSRRGLYPRLLQDVTKISGRYYPEEIGNVDDDLFDLEVAASKYLENQMFDRVAIEIFDATNIPMDNNHTMELMGFGDQRKTIDDIVPMDGWEVKWQLGGVLGVGSFGSVCNHNQIGPVHLGMNLDNGELFAVKRYVFHKEQLDSPQMKSLKKEISLLRSFQHENIVSYLGCSIEMNTINIFLEYMSGGSIAGLLKKFGPVKEALAQVYVRQILQGLHYLHSNGIVHHDIKGGNILVDSRGVIKLADFGASQNITELFVGGQGTTLPTMKGTVFWMAPEVIKQAGYGMPSDIWSLGCTIVELMTGKPPWNDLFDDQIVAIFHIAGSKQRPSFPPFISALGSHFLYQCFHQEPERRATTEALVRHKWILKAQGDTPTHIPLPSSGAKLASYSPLSFHNHRYEVEH